MHFLSPLPRTCINFFRFRRNLQIIKYSFCEAVNKFLFNTVIYVFLLLCLCIRIVCSCIFIVLATLTEGFPCFFLSCKANARVKPAKMGQGPHYSKMFVLFYVVFVLCHSVYCLCVNVYCTVYHIIS